VGKRIVIIGGGAAGMLAAGSAGAAGGSVLLLEKMKQAGVKLLISGKGRCNITNTAGLAEFFKEINDQRFLRYAFSEFFSKEIVSILEKQGVITVEERGGRVFPSSDEAKDVRDSLLKWVLNYNPDIHYLEPVSELVITNSEVKGVKTRNGKQYSCDALILATGGLSYPATGSTGEGLVWLRKTGHTIIPVRPGLVPLVTEGNIAAGLQGLSLKNINASLWINRKKVKDEFGELLFTHYGLSGPVILTLSRFIDFTDKTLESIEISIDLKPALDDQKLDLRLLRELDDHSKMHFRSILELLLPRKLAEITPQILNIPAEKPAHQISAQERKKLRLFLKDFRFRITGNRGFKEAIITSGGLDLHEVDSKTMGSKLVKNLYVCGEMLNLDANTGGFNLQIAWSTGWVAGKSAALGLGPWK